MTEISTNTYPFIPRISYPSSRAIPKADLALLGPSAAFIQASRGGAHGYSRRAFQEAQRHSDIATMGQLVNNISDLESWHVEKVKRLNQILGEMQKIVINARIETNECERRIAGMQRGLQGGDAAGFICTERVCKGFVGQRERDEEGIKQLRGQMKRVQEKVMDMDRDCEERRKVIWEEIEARWKEFVDELRQPIMPQVYI